jgi:hypothetical protein
MLPIFHAAGGILDVARRSVVAVRRRSVFLAVFVLFFPCIVFVESTSMANQQSENITPARALEIARKAVDDLKASQPFVIIENKTQTKDFGWVFFYTSKKFLETHDRKDLIPGNGPLVVDRLDGTIHFLSSSLPPNRAIEEYEKNWRTNHHKQ